ncbi:MAG: LysM peptidoglycan-binding domain-containing protein [Lachnospiraceae bacterium]|nr:LysM peptidoglycan-binding domain-containing protein [Lachnospiraceae bacterium]
MIEIVKEGESRVYKREIPKNVRQIGEVRGKTKIYIEDYITTFMKQISTRDDKPKALILYGDRQSDGDVTLLFVNGAILAECNEETQGDLTVFKEDVWKDVNEKAGHFFKESSVLGWIYLRYDLSDFVDAPVINTHKQFFREDQQIYMEYSVGERIENLYLFEKGSMHLQSGYFVYYERNEAMQNYMITVKQDEPEEAKPEVDKAAKKFRGIVQEKKEEIHRKQTMGMLYGTSVAMLLIVTIIGVTMLNNYEKMQNMEKVLYDISAQMVDEETGAEIEAGKVEVVTEDAALVNAATESPAGEEIPGEDQGNQSIPEQYKESPQEAVSDNAVPQEPVLSAGAEAGEPQPESVVQPVETDPVIEAQEGLVIPGTYCIEKGDTLAKISMKFYGNESMIDKICEVNGIADKNSIQYGVNIVLP